MKLAEKEYDNLYLLFIRLTKVCPKKSIDKKILTVSPALASQIKIIAYYLST